MRPNTCIGNLWPDASCGAEYSGWYTTGSRAGGPAVDSGL